jgi:predicted MFS family arabinose efflux permease
MTTSTERWPGRIALMVAHCAGMVDLVALPVWVGTLIAHYHLDPQQAGGLATLFLVGAVASSLFFAPRLQRLHGRAAAVLGFVVAGVAFLGVTFTSSYTAMAVLHGVAGIGAACALSITHGTIARSERPHRLFALVGIALGVFAVLFLGFTPKLVAAAGGAALFQVFGGVMLLAAAVCAGLFPMPPRAEGAASAPQRPGRIDAPVWFGALGISGMTVVQAMVFSFLERIGADRGFGLDAVTGVLVALGIVNLFPAVLAAALERRLSARRVVMAGPVVQAALALTITQSAAFVPYAGAAMFFAAVMIFTHTFAFGLIAKLDPSGRALAATPAMLMVGSALGPILGGTLVKFHGYASLGLAAVALAAVAVAFFSRARRPDAVALRAVA